MNEEASKKAVPITKLPANVELLGAASLLNDIASEMIFPLMPAFLLSLPGGSKTYLGLIEGVADSVASLLKLWSGAWSDRAGWRKGLANCVHRRGTLAVWSGRPRAKKLLTQALDEHRALDEQLSVAAAAVEAINRGTGGKKLPSWWKAVS